MAVQLDLTDEEATLLWCRFVRARDGLRKALKKQNLGDAGYYFGWLDAELTKLKEATPANLAPDGNETDKP